MKPVNTPIHHIILWSDLLPVQYKQQIVIRFAEASEKDLGGQTHLDYLLVNLKRFSREGKINLNFELEQRYVEELKRQIRKRL